jgi:hypothetical protein
VITLRVFTWLIGGLSLKGLGIYHHLSKLSSLFLIYRQSNPFAENWKDCCKQCYDKEVTLQIDTPTRWSSTVSMLSKAFSVKEAVERMHRVTINTEHNVSFFKIKYLKLYIELCFYILYIETRLFSRNLFLIGVFQLMRRGPL